MTKGLCVTAELCKAVPTAAKAMTGTPQAATSINLRLCDWLRTTAGVKAQINNAAKANIPPSYGRVTNRRAHPAANTHPDITFEVILYQPIAIRSIAAPDTARHPPK